MKKVFMLVMAVLLMFTLAACSNKALEEAQIAVEDYNSEIMNYNEKIAPFNEAVQSIIDANNSVDEAINAAQTELNKGETPYDPETVNVLKTAMSDAQEAKVSVPEMLPTYENLIVNEEAKKEELIALTEQAIADTTTMKEIVVPEIPEIPDYATVIENLKTSQQQYEDSIQSLKQVTAPTDEFVKERLQRVDTITAMAAVTEDHDPNGQLNKQGGYIGCIYFTDTQVDRSLLYFENGNEDIIDVGTEGGGAIEIFQTADEALVRDTYLASFDGRGALASGSHYVVGSVIIRTSNQLTGTQQKELTEKITNALIEVDN